MVRILAGIFIKNRLDYANPSVRKSYGIITGVLGIVLNILLSAGKFFAGIISGSISIIADAFNNLSDAGSSLISLVGFHIADKKPDSDHPFGHGRMEYISGLVVSMLILVMGFELGKSSIEKIISPQPIETDMVTIIILVAAILVKVYMNFYNRYYGNKINSASMKATAMDSLSDVVATTVVLISVIVSKYSGLNIDGYTGMAVSVFIFYAGIRSIKETSDPLLGQAPDPDFVKEIRQIVSEYPDIVGIHDLIVHDYGPGRRIVSLHGEVSEKGDMVVLHDMIDRCERDISDRLNCLVTIHMDPITINDARVDGIKQMILEQIHAHNEKITIHDFRIVDGPSHTNIIFDAVMPNDYKGTDKQLRKRFEEIIESLPGNCVGVITIDRQFSEW